MSSYYGASPIPVSIPLTAPARRTRHGNIWNPRPPEHPHLTFPRLRLRATSSNQLHLGLSLATVPWPLSGRLPHLLELGRSRTHWLSNGFWWLQARGERRQSRRWRRFSQSFDRSTFHFEQPSAQRRVADSAWSRQAAPSRIEQPRDDTLRQKRRFGVSPDGWTAIPLSR